MFVSIEQIICSTSKLGKLSNEDRISNLADPILTHILCFLPTKSAMQTTLLSKRWKPLFMSLPNLDFDDHKYYSDDFNGGISTHKINFMNFVDKILMGRGYNLNLERFSLNCVGNYDPNRVDAWIRIVVEHKAKEINFTFKFKELYELYQDFYKCASVEILRLNCKILVHVPEDVSFAKLKVLKFHGVRFSSYESVEKLLLNCPLLEDLAIECCKWLSGCCLSLCGSMLKYLSLDSLSLVCVGKVEPKLLIDAPALQTLTIAEFISEDVLIKENLMFLTTASIDVVLRLERVVESRAFGDMVFGLLNKIYHVKYLTLSENTLGALKYASDYCFPTFHNLNELELLFDTSYWNLLPNILASSPNLQSLVFPHGLVATFSSECNNFSWSPPELVPECLSSHLKTIEIRKFRGTEEELSLVKYFLKQGRALRKISIDCSHVRKDAKILKKLLKFCRGSNTCKLNLLYSIDSDIL